MSALAGWSCGQSDSGPPTWWLADREKALSAVVLVGFDVEKGWVFRSTDTGDEHAVPAEHFRELVRSTTEAGLVARTGWQVSLVNGDRISGIELLLNDRSLSLAGTAYGLLLIPRAQVLEVRNLAALPVYEGPRHGELWLGRTGPQVATEKKLRVPHRETIRIRFAGLPRRFHWRLRTEPVVDFTVQLPAGDPHSAEAVYRLSRTAGTWTLQRVAADGTESRIAKNEQYAFADTAGESSARWDLYADLSERRIWLFCDGVLVCDWQEPSDEDTPAVRHAGDELALEGGAADFFLTEYRLAPWRSSWPSGEKSTDRNASDTLELANGDEILGEARFVQRGLLAFQTSEQLMTVPIQRMALLTMRSPAEKVATGPMSGFVRIWLSNDDVLTLTPKSSTGTDLVGEHPTLGEFRIPFRDIRRMELAAESDRRNQ